MIEFLLGARKLMVKLRSVPHLLTASARNADGKLYASLCFTNAIHRLGAVRKASFVDEQWERSRALPHGFDHSACLSVESTIR